MTARINRYEVPDTSFVPILSARGYAQVYPARSGITAWLSGHVPTGLAPAPDAKRADSGWLGQVLQFRRSCPLPV